MMTRDPWSELDAAQELANGQFLKVNGKIQELNTSIDQMVSYMKLKIDQKDWHAVADASMDIREMEAKKQVYMLLEESK